MPKGYRSKPRKDSLIIAQLFEEAERMGVTQREIGEAVGTDQKMISRYKLGRSNPSVLRLEKMANFLGMELALVYQSEKEP